MNDNSMSDSMIYCPYHRLWTVWSFLDGNTNTDIYHLGLMY